MENKDLHQLLEQQKHSFKPYFSDRVMNRLEQAKETVDDSFGKALDFLFPRLSLASFATLAILLTVAFISNESLDVNTLLGLSSYEESILFQNF